MTYGFGHHGLVRVALGQLAVQLDSPVMDTGRDLSVGDTLSHDGVDLRQRLQVIERLLQGYEAFVQGLEVFVPLLDDQHVLFHRLKVRWGCIDGVVAHIFSQVVHRGFLI